MTNGHGPAVRIESLVRHLESVKLDWQLAQHAECLGREGLMHFPDVDVLGLQFCRLRAFAMAKAGAIPMN